MFLTEGSLNKYFWSELYGYSSKKTGLRSQKCLINQTNRKKIQKPDLETALTPVTPTSRDACAPSLKGSEIVKSICRWKHLVRMRGQKKLSRVIQANRQATSTRILRARCRNVFQRNILSIKSVQTPARFVHWGLMRREWGYTAKTYAVVFT